METETKKVNDKNTKAQDSTKKIEELERTVEQLKDLLLQMSVQNVQNTSKSSLNDEVAIISNLNGTIDIEFSTWRLTMSKFGQRIIITRSQLQELVNSYRSYFESEYILIDSKYADLAYELNVSVYDPTSKQMIKTEDLEKVAGMDTYQLEAYYSKLSENMQRIFVSYFMNRCYEKDKRYYDVPKMTVLNRLTGERLFDNLISARSKEA